MKVNVRRRALLYESVLIVLAVTIIVCNFVALLRVTSDYANATAAKTAHLYSFINYPVLRYLLLCAQILFVVLGLINMWLSEKLMGEKRNWAIIFAGILLSFIASVVISTWSRGQMAPTDAQLETGWALYLTGQLVSMIFLGAGIGMLERPFRGIKGGKGLKVMLIIGVWVGQLSFPLAVLARSRAMGMILLAVSVTVAGSAYAAVRYLQHALEAQFVNEEEEVLVVKVADSSQDAPAGKSKNSSKRVNFEASEKEDADVVIKRA